MSPHNRAQASFLKGLGQILQSPDRLNVMYLLIEGAAMRPSDIAEAVGKPQPNISYHLGRMRDSGFLTSMDSTGDARETLYKIPPDRCERIRAILFQ